MMTPLALLMHRSIEQVPPGTPLTEVAKKMREKKIGSLFVGDAGQTIGIVSETDLVRKAMAGGVDPAVTPVEKVMSRPVISIDIDKTAFDANNLMAAHGIRHLAITDGEQIVGVLSVRDLVICFKNRL
jgi:CBS domain-containing protein